MLLSLELNYLNVSNSRAKRRKIEKFSSNPALFDKVRVVEVYSGFFDEKNPAAIQHELLGNFEVGENLRNKYHPTDRHIWSINTDITEKVDAFAKKYPGKRKELLNLATTQSDNPLRLTSSSKLIVVAQGNIQEEQIADLSSDAFIEMLKEDLGIPEIAELELIVCKIGQCKDYIQEIKNCFNKTKIVAYSSILSSTNEGEVIGFDDENLYIENIDTVKKII
ncbi:MAG: hypothetical protein K1000chlam3_01207 [Chlamydiae bacterium]|nr:hypothetical protein [Chlamydiota bacterium]